MKQEDYFFLSYIEFLELCNKWWKMWEEWIDLFWYSKNKEED